MFNKPREQARTAKKGLNCHPFNRKNMKEKPIQPEIVHQMNGVMTALNDIFEPYSVILMVFKNDGSLDAHTANYISKSNRKDMICAMKEFIARNEGAFLEGNNIKH